MYSVHEITVAPCLYNNFCCCWDDRHLTLQASSYIEIILMIGRIMGVNFHQQIQSSCHLNNYFKPMESPGNTFYLATQR